LLQVVGSKAKTAVVHEKANLTMVSNSLKWKDENKRLGQSNIQIHYEGAKANVYPYNPDRFKAKEITATKAAPVKTEPAKMGTAKADPPRGKNAPKVKTAKISQKEFENRVLRQQVMTAKTAKPKEKELEFGDGGR
jgi:hypothetical protein